MSAQRESWSARSGFILAAIGSAVGLGNIWRFPYVSYENGGGAFFIPYLVALLTAGFPLLFLDYVTGQKYRGAPPTAYRRMVRSAEGVGWWQVLVCTVIGIYYASVLSWAGQYTLYSFSQAWGEDTEGFFFNHYLQNGSGLDFTFVPSLFVGILIVWAVVLFIMYGGIRKGVELANKIFIPLLVVMFVIMVIQAVRLPGAVEGLNTFFTPNWTAMAHPKVWLAAYGHVFFSMSIGFGIMVTYSSYLKRNANLTGSGLVVGFANSSFEILAGIGIFSVLGFMAVASGKPVAEVVSGGIGLAFVAFPKIISSMGEAGTIIGVLFFASLFVAGLTSMASIIQVPISAVEDKFGWSHKKAVTVVGGISALISLALFSTKTAITFVDVIDHFANNIGVVFGAVLSIIWVTWLNRGLLDKLIRHINGISSIKIGKGWAFMLTVITPISLIIALLLSVKSLLTEGYGGYDFVTQAVFGWGVVAVFALGALLLTKTKGHSSHDAQKGDYHE
ncbi:SNF family Na+-dependent transporter [Moraxella bovoculi]|uniref:Transporter n=1 Tax=Moraxella bovoculi TaxID=386891 RepID=A0AAC8PVG0_9GAMM|nr:sodium-dependent transporter [Moraxella bovoculi]AKG07556.1 SNF family Na+-dependent transporter [Moraxella bovoculi]AKG09840.1 SNF family Na+-dependent transporter [Moraxella bovoculi]AKG11760.1 SNF family Na+-dependent transporter [Moraxella bovoculi]AKG13726.1 SNF family Na+-dependent transporter [Moraxella bovoculi]